MQKKARRGFTLTELMVAVLIMVIVIVATSKIFGTVGRVVGVGEAGALPVGPLFAQALEDALELPAKGVDILEIPLSPNRLWELAAGESDDASGDDASGDAASGDAASGDAAPEGG